MMNLYVVFATASNPQAGGPMGLLVTFAPLLLIFGVMYFLMIRPQKKREKELRSQVDAMREGDTVLTIGGVVGRIMNITNDEVTIATSVANTLITFKKTAISSVQSSVERTAVEASTEKNDKVQKSAETGTEDKKGKKWWKRESDVE